MSKKSKKHAKKANTTNNTATTAPAKKAKQETAKKAPTTKKSETMTYGQVRALAAALFHANYTKAEMSKKIDELMEKLGQKADKPMPADKKAEWLKKSGKEPATYGQCMMFAMCLFNGKTPYEQVSAIIQGLDEKSGYKKEAK